MNTSKKLPLIDLTFINELTKNNFELKLKILGQFLPVIKENLNDISENLIQDEPDKHKLKKNVHDIKPMCSYLGMHKLHDAAIDAKKYENTDEFIDKVIVFNAILQETLPELVRVIKSLRIELSSDFETDNVFHLKIKQQYHELVLEVIQELSEAIYQKNIQKLKNTIHKIRPSLTEFGFNELEQAAKKIKEEADNSPNWSISSFDIKTFSDNLIKSMNNLSL